MSSKEIELKFKINQKTKDDIVDYLLPISHREKTIHMIDTYYIPDFRDFEVNGETMECVRIRENDGKIVLGYKKIHREAKPLYCDEYELEIQSKVEMEKILFALGFTIQMVIDKTRETYIYENYKFDIDYVVDLGYLLEVELINNENAKTDIEKILETLKKYGLTKKDVTYDGIQVLMKKAKGIK